MTLIQRLAILLSFACGLLALAFAAVWVRGLITMDQLDVHIGDRHVIVTSYPHHLKIQGPWLGLAEIDYTHWGQLKIQPACNTWKFTRSMSRG